MASAPTPFGDLPPGTAGGASPGGGAAQDRPAWAGSGARKLGRYFLGPLLGSGGMGEVYEAWDGLLNRRVALKSLTVPYPDAIIRFLREAQLQARVTHPNVCRIYDVDASEEVPFIAMQLIQGPTLYQAAPSLSALEAVEILQAVALAINAAHRLHLIHRDLKPSNILLEPDGMGGWNSFVVDFGLAKDLTEHGQAQTHVPMGTPEYMAPEQKRGDAGAMGPAVDIYALGATLSVVLGLSRGMARSGWRQGAQDGQTTAPARALPRKLRVIVARCLEERPQDRYHSAGELAEDLRRFLDGEPLLAQRGRRYRELRRTLRRHPALAAALAACLMLGAGFTAWSVRMGARSHRQVALAQRFALDARDVEHRMRIERIIPTHDIRPTLLQMQQQLAQVRADMATLGPEAQGPGNLALGWGYTALGRLDLALEALDAAWQGGFATPDTAYALCKLHCAYCRRLAPWGVSGRALEALAESRARHLRAARDFFTQASGENWEPPQLGEAGLLIQEGAYEDGLAKAREAFLEAPWLYEAKVEEARALQGLGLRRLDLGEEKAALSLFREASLAAREAQAIGESDEVCYLVDLGWRFRLLAADRHSRAAVQAAWAGAGRLVDRALAIRPDGPQGVAAKTELMLARAWALAAAGRDPEPELRQAERFLAPWSEQPELGQLVAQARTRIQDLRLKRH